MLSKAYYLGPDKGGERAYRLLSRALRETGLTAVAKYAARGKQYLVLVRPQEDGLVLEQLYYADELKPFSEVPVGESEVKAEELALATTEFRPDAYGDEVRQRMQEQIERKVAGEEITTRPSEEPQTQIIDLMEALKASLAQGTGKGKEASDDKRQAG